MADTEEGLIVMLLIREATAESSLTGPAFGAAFAGAFCAGDGPCRTIASRSPDAHRGHEPPHAHRCIAGVGDGAADGGAAGCTWYPGPKVDTARGSRTAVLRAMRVWA